MKFIESLPSSLRSGRALIEGFLAARWAVPLAALASVYGIATLQKDPTAVAESRFLALLIAGILAAIAAIATRRRDVMPILGGTALLACAASWIAYQGPSRGAVVTLLLVLGLAWVLGKALLTGSASERRLDVDVTVPAAIGCQLVMRSDLLLPPLLDLRTLVSLLVLPAVVGWAVSLLGARFGSRPALLAAGTVLALTPGWNVTTTLAVVSLAAGASLSDPDLPRWGRGMAVAVLVLLTWWNLPLGALTVLAGLSLWARGQAALILPAMAVAVALVTPSAGGWLAAAELGAAGMVLLPALLLVPLANERRPMQWAAHGLIFALLAARVSAGPEVLAGGLALVALAVPSEGLAAFFQRIWTSLLLLGTGLLASYPWMRISPRDDLVDLLGLGNPWLAFAVAGGLVLSCHFMDHPRSPSWVRQLPLVLVVLLVAVPFLTTASPSVVVVNSYRPVTIDDTRHHWDRALDGGPVSTVVLDTNLVHGASLEPGTPVAIIELLDEEGRQIQTWRIFSGEDTAEWAAARPDVAATPGFVAPPPWISRLAPDGTFFSRLFRSRLESELPRPAAKIRIRRALKLPVGPRVVIYRLELRR